MIISNYVKGTELKFTIDVKELNVAINKLRQLVQMDKGTLLFAIGTETSIIGYNGPNFVKVGVSNASSDDVGCLSVDHKTLANIIQGRSILYFTFTGKVLKFSDNKKYVGEVATSDVDQQIINICNKMFDIDQEEHTILHPDVWKALRNNLRECSISDVHTNEKIEIPRYVSIYEKGIDVASYDNYHMVYTHTDIDCNNNLSFVITNSYFTTMEKISKDNDLMLSINKNGFCIRCDTEKIIAIRPHLQYDESGIDKVLDYIEEIENGKSKKVTTTCEVNSKLLSRIISNLPTTPDDNITIVSICMNAKTLEISMKTKYAAVQDKLKVAVKGKAVSFKVDKKVLEDILLVMPEGNYTLSAVSSETMSTSIFMFESNNYAIIGSTIG